VNDRIKTLRQQSLDAKPYISPERAKLITEFYKSNESQKVSTPVQRALAFKYLLEKKAICIHKGELIVGERGPASKATPTYPEITAHSLKDLRILDKREKTSFSVDTATKELYRDVIIPFWRGRSIRDRIFDEVDEEWIEAYEAGVFTEFMEQRAPGHTVLDDKIYKKGFLDFKKDIQKSIKALQTERPSWPRGKKTRKKRRNWNKSPGSVDVFLPMLPAISGKPFSTIGLSIWE
jgi:pyruvate-formate lyase